MSSATGLVTTAALNKEATGIENKILSLKKPQRLKITDTTGFIATLKFNRLTDISFEARTKVRLETSFS